LLRHCISFSYSTTSVRNTQHAIPRGCCNHTQ
jgi:hypothetical protein